MPAVRSTLKGLEEIANEVLVKLPKLADQLGDTLMEAKKSLRALSDAVVWVRGDDSGLKKVLVSFDDAARTLQKAVRDAEIAQMTSSVRGAAGSVNDAARGLGGQSGQLEETLRALRETLEAVRALAARLERDPSAIVRGRHCRDTPTEGTWHRAGRSPGLPGAGPRRAPGPLRRRPYRRARSARRQAPRAHRRRRPRRRIAGGPRALPRTGRDPRAGCPRRASPRRPRAYWTRITRKSFTLVRVGPVTTRSPSGAKNP